ncbi:CPBP family intramembrane glutamic endopeptidase [Paenibacillus cremeus]|uniref:CPBP family intramembrane metalloprotease n=1 Tax=Paenibacillus cremeus TaxID=2163881 RepID=A0A559JVN0_9BACL|nr:CPBP family intramembrane glutamic endopeptidase [Paenibacillus cremeus]TVY03942.1 CPBP family intramembrane metalloprotease [Paenibacillus cremeus]
MRKRLSEPSLLIMAVIGLIMYLGVAFLSPYLGKGDRVDEETEAQPAISKQQAADAALQFARSRFQLSTDTETNTMFQSYTLRSGYLQKEHLYEKYTKQFGERFPLDYYEVEINDRSTGLNYFIAVNFTSKQIIGWERNKTATSKASTVSSGETDTGKLVAQAMKDMGYAPDDFVKKEDTGSTVTPGGLAYESKTVRLGDARLTLVLKLGDGQVTAFRPAFTVPQSFIAWQAAQDDQATLMTRVSMLLSLFMGAAAIWIVIRYRREIRFRTGLILTLVFLAVYIANNFNMTPAFRTSHGSGPTDMNMMIYLWFVNIFVVLMGLSAYFSMIAGQKLWHDQGFPSWPRWREASFGAHVKLATARGYLICLFILGLQQVLFLAAGEVFDVWAVSDPADSVYNMIYPGLFPLMAWAAAISEEAIYRFLGIALFWRLTRNRFLAVLLPSIIWAMSHTQYPIYPVYTRLVEVSVIGLVFGWTLLRYGFLTALFAHAAMDSILMGLSLMYMGSVQHAITGAAYLVIPALIGWLIARFHGYTRAVRE